MPDDPKRLTDQQKRQLGRMLQLAFCEIRLLGWDGKAEQAADLADAFHNLPVDMWLADFSLVSFRDIFLAGYMERHPDTRRINYVALADEILAMDV